MPLPLSIQVPPSTVSGIRDRLHQSIDSAREQLVQAATQAALDDIAQNVPVETGETRTEWQAELARIAASPPSSPAPHLSLQSATNPAPQAVYLEYGTVHMQPRPTAGPALTRLRSILASLFHLMH